MGYFHTLNVLFPHCQDLCVCVCVQDEKGSIVYPLLIGVVGFGSNIFG